MLAVQFQLEQSQWWPAQRLLERQFEQLRAVAGHAVANVPHYRHHLRRCGVSAVGELTPENFRRWPVLRRADLQDRFPTLKASHYPRSHGRAFEMFTSGSTAMPTRVLYTEAAQFFAHALGLREHLWHGRQFAGKLAAIRFFGPEGRQPGWSPATNAVFQTGPASIMEVSTDVETQLKWLLAEQPDYLFTTPSNLRALLAAAGGLRPASIKGVMTYSEPVPAGLRQALRDAWNASLTDTYSCTEFGPLALQCPAGAHYHMQSENVYVEVLREDGNPCGPGETGRIVVSGLHNFAMPLLRYELGDMVEPGDDCACGRGLPVLRSVAGRVRNMARDARGRLFQPGFDEAMEHAGVPLRQYQIIQHAPASLEVLYVAHAELEAEERARLERALARGMGYRVDVVLTPVPAIPRSPGGKYEGFVSRIADEH